MTEALLLKQILLHAQVSGGRLFRNQVSRYKIGDRFMSSGLCVGSSDLVGWTPVKIHAGMVGRTVAVFTAVEVKSAPGRLRPEQRAFLKTAQHSGAIACCARTLDDVDVARKTFLR